MKGMTQYDSRRIRLARIEAMLQEKPMTKSEVSEATGYSRGSVWKCFDDLIGRNRIYVAKWEISGNRNVGRYGFGNLPDVPRPLRIEREDDDEEIVFKRPRVIVNVRRDPLDVAPFGEYRAAA